MVQSQPIAFRKNFKFYSLLKRTVVQLFKLRLTRTQDIVVASITSWQIPLYFLLVLFSLHVY